MEKIDILELHEDIRGDEVKADLEGAYKSVYFNDTKEMGAALNKVSPSFSMLIEAFLTLFLPPMVKSTFLISKKFLIIFLSEYI